MKIVIARLYERVTKLLCTLWAIQLAITVFFISLYLNDMQLRNGGFLRSPISVERGASKRSDFNQIVLLDTETRIIYSLLTSNYGN